MNEIHCLVEAHPAHLVYVSAVNDVGERHEARALYCPQCARAWVPVVRVSESGSVWAEFDLSV